MLRLFLTTAWTGSGTPFDYALPNGETARVYQTLQNAYADANASGDVLQPAPPGTPGFSFYDENGVPLQTVTINLGTNFILRKEITIQGGWCRLRFDGGGLHRFGGQASGEYYFEDLDVVNCVRAFVRQERTSGIVNLKRCLIAGTTDLVFCWGYVFNCVDCVLVDNKRYDYGEGTSKPEKGKFTRCTTDCGGVFIDSDTSADNIVLKDLTPAQLAAVGFIAAPKAIDTSNLGYYTDGTAFTGAVWKTADLRLLSTSPYATGATSVTSGQTVYDVAGNKRKPGGALGAYEVFDDVTLRSKTFHNGWYTFERDDETAPIPIWCAWVENIAKTNIINAMFDRALTTYHFRQSLTADWSNLASWGSGKESYIALRAYPTYQVRASSNGGTSWTTFTFYDANPPEGAIPFKAGFEGARIWQTPLGANASASSSSVCYVDGSIPFASTGGQVAKTYVGGWARPNFGNADVGELELGLGAIPTIAGKATLKNLTATSEDALANLDLRYGAELTFKNCAISDPTEIGH